MRRSDTSNCLMRASFNRFTLPGFLLALIATVGCGSTLAQLSPKPLFVNVLAGSIGGVFYPLGSALSTILAESELNAKTSVQVTKGTTDNLHLLYKKKGELAFAQGDVLLSAWEGNVEAGFSARYDSLRGIAALHLNIVHILTLDGAGVYSMADLKGKRVSVGPAGSGTELNARGVLRASGLTYGDLRKVEYVPYEIAVDLIKNRKIDAAFQTSGLGLPAIRDLTSAFPVLFIPVGAETVAKLGPPFIATMLPKGSYIGQGQDIPAVGMPNFLVTRADIPDEAVYQIAKALFSSLPRLAQAHRAGASIKLERALDGLPIPVHPGAERYFREVGLLN